MDAVDYGAPEKELSLEKEYQRVSISGEEKCGVRSHFVYAFLFSRFFTQLLLHSMSPPGAFHGPGGCCKVCGEGFVHPGEVHQSIYAEFL